LFWVGLPAVAIGFFVSGWVVARLQGLPAVWVYVVSESMWNIVRNASTWHDFSLSLVVAMTPVMVMFQLLRVFTLAGGLVGYARRAAAQQAEKRLSAS
jgi:chromate transport protein ChrA